MVAGRRRRWVRGSRRDGLQDVDHLFVIQDNVSFARSARVYTQDPVEKGSDNVYPRGQVSEGH